MWVDILSLRPEWARLWFLDHFKELSKFAQDRGFRWDSTHLSREQLTIRAKEFFSEVMELPTIYNGETLFIRIPEDQVIWYKLKV